MTVKSAVEGTYQGGLTEFGLAEDGVGFAVDQYNESLITEEMLETVERARTEIVEGRIDVPTE
jgi:basic membrane protein A